MDFNLFKIWHDLAVNTYNVDPAIFIFLMIVTAPLLWFGTFWIIKELIAIKNKKKDKKDGLIEALIFYLIFWALPYVYILFWGQGIPLWFWIIFFGWLALSLYLFKNKLKEKTTLGK